MADIAILNLESANPGRLTIDVVVRFLSAVHHISRLTYTRSGLYDVARTYESPGCPIDIHSSYHPSGEMHCKLTQGKLSLYPGGQVLGRAQPHTDVKEVVCWQRKAQPWQSLAGVERLGPDPKGSFTYSFSYVRALEAGYPVYCHTDADYVFEIGAESLMSSSVIIGYFLVEPGNIAALEGTVKKTTDGWSNPYEAVTLKRAEVYTNLSPWLAIVLLAKVADN